VGTSDELIELRRKLTVSWPYWWPDIEPIRDGAPISFLHRIGRVGPLTILETNYHDEAWVSAAKCSMYQVTLPVGTSSAAVGSGTSSAATPGSFVVYRPEDVIDVRRPAGPRLTVMIKRHALEEALADAVGRPVTSQVDFRLNLASRTAAVRSWMSLVWMLTAQLFQPGSVVQRPIVGMPFADTVIRGLLMSSTHPYRAALIGEATELPPRAIREAIDIIEAEPHEPLTVATLAARSHCSVRSLQLGFSHIGTTPMAYLRDVRLRRARQELRESDPTRETVGSIAARWGFSNLGRFAAAYAYRYGENPAATLRQSGGLSRGRTSPPGTRSDGSYTRNCMSHNESCAGPQNV
jgi:AraC-like DNA-binding protein